MSDRKKYGWIAGLFALAFTANTMMDEIDFHWHSWRVLHWLKDHNFPRLYKWLRSDWRDKPDYAWYDLRQMYMDGWHFFKSVLFCSLGAVFTLIDYRAGILYFAHWALVFTVPHMLWQRYGQVKKE
jgi:hypothetical protein